MGHAKQGFTVLFLQSSTDCPLPTAHCPLPTAHCLVSPAIPLPFQTRTGLFFDRNFIRWFHGLQCLSSGVHGVRDGPGNCSPFWSVFVKGFKCAKSTIPLWNYFLFIFPIFYFIREMQKTTARRIEDLTWILHRWQPSVPWPGIWRHCAAGNRAPAPPLPSSARSVSVYPRKICLAKIAPFFDGESLDSQSSGGGGGWNSVCGARNSIDCDTEAFDSTNKHLCWIKAKRNLSNAWIRTLVNFCVRFLLWLDWFLTPQWVKPYDFIVTDEIWAQRRVNTVSSLMSPRSRDSISTGLCHSTPFERPNEQGGATVEIESRDRRDMKEPTVLPSKPDFLWGIFWISLHLQIRTSCSKLSALISSGCSIRFTYQ